MIKLPLHPLLSTQVPRPPRFLLEFGRPRDWSSGISGCEGPQVWLASVGGLHPKPISHTFPELQAWTGMVETKRKEGYGESSRKARGKNGGRR